MKEKTMKVCVLLSHWELLHNFPSVIAHSSSDEFTNGTGAPFFLLKKSRLASFLTNPNIAPSRG
jgi:hypothetical protein